MIYGSAVAGVGILIANLLQPDFLVPLTMVPNASWLVAAAMVLVIGWRKQLRTAWLTLACVSILFALVCVEETWTCTVGQLRNQSLGRTLESEQADRSLRVATLNCAGYGFSSVVEVLNFKPDVILLQESPSREDVARLATEAFGDQGASIWNFDTSIVARGKLSTLACQPGQPFVAGALEMESGRRVRLVSLRLLPPVMRLDFWSGSFWQDHCANRVRHRQQISEMLASLRSQDSDTSHVPWVVGGDFNSVAKDGALQPLVENGLSDVFLNARRGYGATGTNAVPLFRVDQIWIDRHLSPGSATAVSNSFSDHRAVIADLRWPQPASSQ